MNDGAKVLERDAGPGLAVYEISLGGLRYVVLGESPADALIRATMKWPKLDFADAEPKLKFVLESKSEVTRPPMPIGRVHGMPLPLAGEDEGGDFGFMPGGHVGIPVASGKYSIRFGHEESFEVRLPYEAGFRPGSLHGNVPTPGLVFIESVTIGGVNVDGLSGTDAAAYNPALRSGAENAARGVDLLDLAGVHLDKDGEIVVRARTTRATPTGWEDGRSFDVMFSVMARGWRKRREATAKRLLEIDPNRDSDIKVEGYVFPLETKVLEPGKDRHLIVAGSPAVPFRAKGMRINVTRRGILFVKAVRVANVGAVIGGPAITDPATGLTQQDGDYWIDAFDMNERTPIDLPMMAPQNTMSVEYYYSGEPFEHGITPARPWRLTTAFFGPATIVG